MTVYKCLHRLAPKYLAELCVPVADVAGRRQLPSASRRLLNFPCYNVSNYGLRAFCFAWNSLPEHIRQSTSIAVFKRSLKTFLLQQTWRIRDNNILLFYGLSDLLLCITKPHRVVRCPPVCWRCVQAARQVWSAGLCAFHRGRAVTETAERCSTSLRVWWPCGLAVEFVGALVDHVVWSTDFTRRPTLRRLELYAKALARSTAAVTGKRSSSPLDRRSV